MSVRALALRPRGASPGHGPTYGLPQLDLAAGEAVALRGPSGCGKTSILTGMLGLPLHLRREAGTVRVLGEPWPDHTADRRRLLAGPVTVLLQDPKSALDPLHSVGDQIAACVPGERGGRGRAETRQRVLDVLGRLGMDDAAGLCRRIPSHISGGEAQRVLMAIALLRRPKVLLVDEPTAHLDPQSCRVVLDALSQLRSQSRTAVLFATHDDGMVTALGARVFAARDGMFREESAASNLAWPSCPALQTRGSEGSSVVLQATGLASPSLFSGVELSMGRGDVVTLTGASGVGKTTLARQLVGLDVVTSGRVERPGGPRSVQLLWQDARASLTPGLSARSLVDEIKAPGFDVTSQAAALGLHPSLLDRDVDRLSAGEIRRVALLRALCVRPAVLVCDEPTASLDRATAVRLLELLVKVREASGVAILVITHDQELAERFGERSFTMADRTIRPLTATASQP